MIVKGDRMMQELSQPTIKKDFFAPFMEDRVDLRELFYVLLAEKKLILLITAAFVMLAVLYAMTLGPRYDANVLLQIENKSSGGAFGNNQMTAMMGGNTSEPADIQTALMKSRFILAPTIESLGLDVAIQPRYFPFLGKWYARFHQNALHHPWFGGQKYAWGGEKLQIAQMHVAPVYQNTRFILRAGEKNSYQIFTPDKKLLLTAIVGRSAEIKKNQEIIFSILVNTLIANAGTEFYLSKQPTDIMADKLAAQLRIIDLGQFYQVNKTGVLQISLSGSDPESIVNILNAIAENAMDKDVERKSMEAAKVLEFLNQQLPLTKNALFSAEGVLNRYRMQSGTLDLTLRSKVLLNQIATIQKELERVELGHIILLQKLTPLHPDIIALVERKKILETELASIEKQLQSLPSTDQTAVKLMRDVKVKSELYMLLLHKIQESQMIKAGTVSEVRILSLAHAMPMSTGRFFIVFFSIIFGLVSGSAVVLIRRFFTKKVEDPSWLEQQFGIPTFAIIPYSEEQSHYMRQYNEGHNKHLRVLAKTFPGDLSMEALRSLRTSLQFALIGAKNNIISIMGISPQIGKSFVSVNFAHILADTSKRILLVDGDIRKGYLHSYFEKTRSPGLTEAISGALPLEKVIQRTHVPHLDFIATGVLPPNPSELLLSQSFQNILTSLSSQYDLVLIDTAPILAVTDGAIIANQTGVNLLLIGAGKHQAEEIKLAMQRLQSNAVKIQGVIFNNSNAQSNKYTQGRFNYQYEY